jgi:tetratricopeptide (TPR) repeat protein
MCGNVIFVSFNFLIFRQLLALVDEVAVDTVTRGALKEDQTFKGLRDVIKKGNRVLEEMLVRRERKYTLFFRLVQPHDVDQIERMRTWNQKVEKAVGHLTGDRPPGDSESDTASSTSVSSSSSVSSRSGVFSRGRQLIPTAGRVRSRRATPTPRLRKHRHDGGGDSNAGEDGYSAVTPPSEFDRHGHDRGGDEGFVPGTLSYQGGRTPNHLAPANQQIQPKDELVDVIRGLRVEKIRNKDSADDDLAALKPNWLPKADIPLAVPKLPTEYVHRHRLMKQVVSCLLDEGEVQVNKDGQPQNTFITCVTSRHGDKAGNGKTTLAIAVIQAVEVRERFPDGIAWLKLGRGPLDERDIRRLYEDLYRQLIVKEADMDASMSDEGSNTERFQGSYNSLGSDASVEQVDRVVDRADSVRRFHGGDIDGIKEDVGRMLIKQKVLIVLDDVWRVEDAKWFIFETPSYKVPPRDSPFKILITTRTPSLLGNGTAPEVFVRILSEHEAVKLLLSTAGRRPYGGRNSEVFNQSRLIVKGCGNSPLGILLVGSMLRQSNRNWNLKSPVWQGIFEQCSLSLEEAAQLRSFRNAFTRIVDMAFFTINDAYDRIALRRCFVFFALAFRANDWVLSGKGIPQSFLLKFFETIIATGPMRDAKLIPDTLGYLSILENLKLIQRTRHSVAPPTTRKKDRDSPSESSRGEEDKSENESEWDDFDELPKRHVQKYYTMHDSLKAVAELMSERDLPAFTPPNDEFNAFARMTTDEEDIASQRLSLTPPLRFMFSSHVENEQSSRVVTEEKVHELVVIAIIGGGDGEALTRRSLTDAMKANHFSMQDLDGGDKFEEYTMCFLPDHLHAAKAVSPCAELLSDPEFVRRRVFSLGIMEATGRQVADILDLRGIVTKAGPGSGKGVKGVTVSGEHGSDLGLDIPFTFDIDMTVCEAGRLIVDEVYKVTNSMGSSDSLGMATCLATVGEALLKCRQPRDAMLRLEEAVSIYRTLLGPYHLYTAHALQSVAKALVKLGETRVALLKFAEAARIYEMCDATLHYDSISNAQSLASLLVDIGDIRKAESMFEEVISMKQTVYGDNSVPVAKTINNYAILLAKHGRMNDALRHYDIAMSTYRNVPVPLFIDAEFEVKCNYDVTLITLNIASIYSKMGDLERALASYEDGVRGLHEYEASMENIRQQNGTSAITVSSHKHLVAALGRIGSLKLKLSDNEGALQAYEALIEEVDGDSPLASHVEQAKAHIKCATIYRGRDDVAMRDKAVRHLKEALRMYKALYGPDHKDTLAIQTSLKQWLTEDKPGSVEGE